MPRRVLVPLLLLALPVTAGCEDSAEPGDPGAPVVRTAAGDVRGDEQDGVTSWRGIPYAAPPVGDRRWRPPAPVEPWDEVRDARDYGPVCPQAPPMTMADAPDGGRTSEDCLTLNVHRPSGDRADLPVMVWIHGGGFAFGAGSQALYNSPGLVGRGVVLVTFNYRLGALGFLAHPALQGEGEESRVGNFALLDQVAVLEWVRDNIEEFGGDPDNVTVFGESAGGISVNTLMSMPSASGLFAKAISQSGFGRESARTWEAALARGEQGLAPLAGDAATAEDLRALDVEQVMRVTNDVLGTLAPIVDDALPRSVSATFAAGEEADVPYVVGTTDSEVPNAPIEQLGPDGGQVWTLLRTELADRAVAAYGSAEQRDLYLGSDVIFSEPARHLAEAHADDAPTYRYRFGIAPEAVLATSGGAPHTAELAFVFDDTARQGTPVPDADRLADQISDLWVDFATDGEPDGWPTAESGQILSFGLQGPVAQPDPWDARLDLVEAAYGALATADEAG